MIILFVCRIFKLIFMTWKSVILRLRLFLPSLLQFLIMIENFTNSIRLISAWFYNLLSLAVIIWGSYLIFSSSLSYSIRLKLFLVKSTSTVPDNVVNWNLLQKLHSEKVIQFFIFDDAFLNFVHVYRNCLPHMILFDYFSLRVF